MVQTGCRGVIALTSKPDQLSWFRRSAAIANGALGVTVLGKAVTGVLSSIGDHALRMQRAQRIPGWLVIERVAAQPMAPDVAPPATRWATASGLAG